MEGKEPQQEITNETPKAKPKVDMSQFMKKPNKSSFYGGTTTSKNYGSTHGMSTQKNHRQKHG